MEEVEVRGLFYRIMLDHDQHEHQCADEVRDVPCYFSDLVDQFRSYGEGEADTADFDGVVLELIVGLDFLLQLAVVIEEGCQFVPACLTADLEHDGVLGVSSKVGEDRVVGEV